MLDSYGGMTIGGFGFEIDGNGLYPYSRISYSRHEDTAGADGYAMLGLLWNAYHGLRGSDNAGAADYALGLKAPIDYGKGDDYNAASNTVDLSKATITLLKRDGGAEGVRAIYELDMAGKLRVRLGGELKVTAAVLDDTSAQILYTGELNQGNAQITRLTALTKDGQVPLTLGNVNKTQYGVVFGYAGQKKNDIIEMTAYVANTDTDFDIMLPELKKLEARVAALEAGAKA